MLTKKCLYCGQTIFKKKNQSMNTWKNVVKFCSRQCLGHYYKARIIALNKSRVGMEFSEEHRKNMSISSPSKRPWFLGRKYTKEQKERIRDGIIKSQTEEVRLKKSLSHRGSKNCNWRGGVSGLKHRIRTNRLYYIWRKAILERDNYACQVCGSKDNLVSHHTKSIETILNELNITTIDQAIDCKELWDINNGMTLCKECHSKLHKIINLNKKLCLKQIQAL